MSFPDSSLLEKYANRDWNRLRQYQTAPWQAESAGTFGQGGVFNPSQAAQNFLNQYQNQNPTFNPVEIKPVSGSSAFTEATRSPTEDPTGITQWQMRSGIKHSFDPARTNGLFSIDAPDTIYMSDRTDTDPRSMSTLVHELQHRTDALKGSFGFNGKPFHSQAPSEGSTRSMMRAAFDPSGDFRNDANTILNQPSSLGVANTANAELSARLAEKQYLQQLNSAQNLENWKWDPWSAGYPMSVMDSAADAITRSKMNPIPVYVDNDTYPEFPKPSTTIPMKLATEAYPYINTQTHFFGNDVFKRIFSDD